MDGLGSKILRSLKWSYAATAIVAVLQVVVTAVLARLLSPSDYGLIAISYLVVSFGNHIAQMGLGPALIQKSEINDRDIGTAYVTSLALGLTFFAIAWFGAPTAAEILGSPTAAPIIRYLALSFVISSIGMISVSLLRRELTFRVISIIEVSAFVTGSVIVSISLAALGFGVWSLATGQLANALIVALLATIMAAPRTLPRFELKALHSLFSFGSKLSLIRLLQFFSYNIWTVFVSHNLGVRQVGLYNRASLLVQLPAQYISNTVERVGFPSLSQLRSNPERLKRAHFQGSILFAVLLFPFAFSVSASAREIVLVVLGEKWIDAIDVLRIIALAVPFNMMLSFNGILLDAVNKLGTKLTIQIFHFGAICALFWLMLPYGLTGIALAFLIIEIATYVIYFIIVGRLLGYGLNDVRKWHEAIVLPSLMTAGPAFAAAHVFPRLDWSDLTTLVMEMLLALAGYAIALSVFCLPTLKAEIGKLLSMSGMANRPETLVGQFLGWYRTVLNKGETN